MRKRNALLAWTLILAIGAGAVGWVSRLETSRVRLAAAPARPATLAERLASARRESHARDGDGQRLLAAAARLAAPVAFASSDRAALAAAAPAPAPEGRMPAKFIAAAILSAPDGATTLLRAAMERAPRAAPRGGAALAALEAAAPSGQMIPAGVSTYGALTPDVFATHRMTILQLGDSHTAADFFSGRVRERLQQAFGTGGEAFLVPGKPHVGVRSALFESDASDGWNYEAMQKSDAKRRFYLTGFNAVSRHAGAALSLRSRGGRPYDRLEVEFLKQPGGGRAEVLLDGAPSGQINLDGADFERAMLELKPEGASFHEIGVRALSDAPVTVTGVDVGRDGDGVSYLSLGFPGATVQVLQRLAADNFADDLRRMAPDIVVLAFGTNEGFNDNLDIASYTAQYEQIVRRLLAIRPGIRVVIVGPPDAARPTGVCHAAGVGQSCASPPEARLAAEPGGGQCRLPVPPKLAQVRDAQRKLARRLDVEFWDWSSIMPGPCGAQVWAAASPPLMARDYVHMTLDGYRLSADRFADYLIPLIEGRQTPAHVVSNN